MNSNCVTCKPFLGANSLSNAEIHLLFDNCRFYSSKLPEPDVLLFRCPSCGTQREFQVADESIRIGYVYLPLHFAFATEQAVHIKNLKVVSRSVWLQVSIGNDQWKYCKFDSKLHEKLATKINRAKQLLNCLRISAPK